MTTIYISGKMSGLDEHEVTKKFQDAERLLSNIGLQPVSPLPVYQRFTQIKQELPETPDETVWDMAMIEAIQLLLPCDGIFMLSDWSESRGARIERKISLEKAKIILYESSFSTIHRIKEAIREVTGLQFDEYVTKSRNRCYYFSRLIFAYQCRKYECVDLNELANMLNVNYNNASKYNMKYFTELKVNRQFGEMAYKIDSLIKEHVTQ